VWVIDLATSILATDHRRRAPFAHAGVPPAIPFSWAHLGDVLASEPDALVVKDGRLLTASAPRSTAALRALLDEGAGVVVRRAENHDADIAALCRAIAAAVRRQVTVQLFATAAGTHGFGWHYDAEEVFILQYEGEKEYLLRQNTVSPEARAPLPRDLGFERETSPVIRCRVPASGMLHVPRGMWHMAHCLADALSISIGIGNALAAP
jgi:ribosomal protein L16 Arg81 hydroxylase